jgi:Dickkopf-like protein
VGSYFNSTTFNCTCDNQNFGIGDPCGFDCGSVIDDCELCGGVGRSCCSDAGTYVLIADVCVCDNVNACGVCNVTYDVCGVCNGDNSSCALGAPCVEGGDCASGWCSDGVCCDQNCEAFLCRSCSIAGSLGTCTLTPWDVAPRSDECPAAPAGACGNTGQCDGTGACQITNSTVSCGDLACINGKITAAGSGQCNSVTCINRVWTPCPGNFACQDGQGCLGMCNNDTDCGTGYWCNTADNTCHIAGNAGTACGADNECVADFFCVESVCCDEGLCCALYNCTSHTRTTHITHTL